MITSQQIIDFTYDIISKFSMDDMFETGVRGLCGKEATNFFNKAKGQSGEELVDILTEALDYSDGDAEPVVEEMIEHLHDQEWFTDDDFKALLDDAYIRGYIGGYRVIDGKVVSAEEMDDEYEV